MCSPSFAALVVAALVATACGAGEPGASNGASTSPSEELPSTTLPSPDPSQLYEADALVLEAAGDPMLCVGAMTLALPPRCGDLPITNWDWDAVEGEESMSGTISGEFHVVGTLEGDAFTVSEIGPPDPDARDYGSGSNPDFRPPCPEPDGGWVDVDPGTASERDFEKGAARANALPDYVALWVAYVGDPTLDEMEKVEAEGKPLPQRIMNVVVTGDVDGAEAAIREVWGGPLCVTQQEGHTEQELMAIRMEAERWIEDELGLRISWSHEGPLGRGAAEVGVLVDPGGAGQAALDERYGAGMVRLFSALRPVE